MLKMNPIFSLLTLFAAFNALVLQAEAATSGPFTTSTPIPLTSTDWLGTLGFPKFNPSLGTLISVQLDLDGALSTVLTVQNNSGTPSSGTVKTEVQLSVQDGGSNLTTPQLDLLSPNFAYSLAPSASATSGTLTKSGTSSDTYFLPAVLAEFTGPGTITLNASSFTQTLLSNTGGNTAANQVTSALLTGSVLYNYNSVPEPCAAALASFGLLLVAGYRRARGIG